VASLPEVGPPAEIGTQFEPGRLRLRNDARMVAGGGPLLVFGARSLEYDFGPRHPLSPRRFGPGIELLRAVGAEPGLAPEPAADHELEWLHAADYIAAVRRLSADPERMPEAGIGPGDDPAFAGMHEAAATVAGGSIRAVEAILRGDVEHAYQPGGGLHHAMRDRASGFCIYNDVALAIARARQDGLRVLYVDLDVHHGDGVQALHYDDPGVLTISFHQSGRTLFPGTGFVDEIGEGTAAGTSVNVPFEPLTGPDAWLAAVRAVVPPLAAAFGPDIVVSQHGADGHAWDPLANLALTTTAMGEAARLVDRVAHCHGKGRWLATGGGGYAVYSVVPRVWALTWLAGAHREMPARLPDAWLAKWEGDAARWEKRPLPGRFDDEPSLGLSAISSVAAERAGRTVSVVRTVLVPALLDVAERRGWQQLEGAAANTVLGAAPAAGAPPARRGNTGEAGATAIGPVAAISPVAAAPTSVAQLTLEMLDRLKLAPRVIAPADTSEAMTILRAALDDGGVAAGAVAGEWLVGVALAVPVVAANPAAVPAAGADTGPGGGHGSLAEVDRLVALGVAPGWRRGGLATAMLRALIAETTRGGRALVALHTVADRDVVDPLPRAVRRGVAEQLARGAGMAVAAASARVLAVDPDARLAVLLPPGAPGDIRARIEDWASRL
jgi:acetoin utilization protein AcuC